jgi:hypothetical protein
VLEYKEFIGPVHFSADDLISYKGTAVVELMKNFHNAVDASIFFCREAGNKTGQVL